MGHTWETVHRTYPSHLVLLLFYCPFYSSTVHMSIYIGQMGRSISIFYTLQRASEAPAIRAWRTISSGKSWMDHGSYYFIWSDSEIVPVHFHEHEAGERITGDTARGRRAYQRGKFEIKYCSAPDNWSTESSKQQERESSIKGREDGGRHAHSRKLTCVCQIRQVILTINAGFN